MKKNCPSQYIVEVEMQGAHERTVYCCRDLKTADELVDDFSRAIRESRSGSFFGLFRARNFMTGWPEGSGGSGQRKTLYNPDHIIRVTLRHHDNYLRENPHMIKVCCPEGSD